MSCIPVIGAAAAMVLAAFPLPALSAQPAVLNDPVVWSGVGNSPVRVQTPNNSVVNIWGCTDADSYFVLGTLTPQVQSRILAVLLTAKAIGKPVTVLLDGCESSRPAIIAAYF